MSPIVQPIAVEQPFKIELKPLPLKGTIDIETKPMIRDLKTTTKMWGAARASEEIQPVFYSLAYTVIQKKDVIFCYDVLTHNGKHKPFYINCNSRDYRILFTKIQLFLDALKKGVFLPTLRTNWWCSERF